MDSADLAKEILAFTMLRDRPSPLALVLHRTSLRGNRVSMLTVTAPIENGKQILRVVSQEHSADGRIALNYQRDNSEAVAALIESKMVARGGIRLFAYTGYEVVGNQLTEWLFDDESGQNSRTLRIQEIHQILPTLFTI